MPTLLDLEALKKDLKCLICTDLCEEPVQTPCGHVFCKECAEEALETVPQCPLCRQRATRRSLYPVLAIERIIADLQQIGTEVGCSDIGATQRTQVPIQAFDPAAAALRLRAQMMQQKPKVDELDAMSQVMLQSKSLVPTPIPSPGRSSRALPPSVSGVDSDSDSERGDEGPGEAADLHDQEAITRKVCDEGHPLVLKHASEGAEFGWKCNMKNHPPCFDCPGGTGAPCDRWTCGEDQCDFDLCTRCLPPPAEQDSSLCVFCGAKNTEAVLSRVLEEHSRRWRAATRLNIKFKIPENTGMLRYRLGKFRKGLREETPNAAHELCLLWAEGTEMVDGQCTVPSAARAIGKALKRRCYVCGRIGAGMACGESGCTRRCCTLCGFFAGGMSFQQQGRKNFLARKQNSQVKCFCFQHKKAEEAPGRPAVSSPARSGAPSLSRDEPSSRKGSTVRSSVVPSRRGSAVPPRRGSAVPSSSVSPTRPAPGARTPSAAVSLPRSAPSRSRDPESRRSTPIKESTAITPGAEVRVKLDGKWKKGRVTKKWGLSGTWTVEVEGRSVRRLPSDMEVISSRAKPRAAPSSPTPAKRQRRAG
eukprot:Hpha_TRINITY_DN10780_c0_g1::TRINITY_DN10780_c0_g1_i1::g.43504::m.43504